ncbi:MAG: OST-HTH/LOTUS domain-containing protein [Deltaproteobacteria bacterium]|nr:OST-HTH/LOTUS domain-containing protein [Deltaproteobacteria bacterium]
MHGKYVVGIGARNSSNIYWIKSCNEFKYYHTLVTRAEDAEDGAASADQRPDFDGAMDLLERAVGRLARSHDGRVPLIAVRPMMIRLDPSFDENDYGHDNMKAFVEACRDVVRLDDTPDGAIVTLVSDAEAFTVDVDSPEEMENLYRNTLRRIQYRLLPPEERLHALDVLHEILKENAPVEDQAAVKELLMDRFEKDGRPIGDEEAQHVWDMGFKANAYYFQDYPFRNIVINENVTSPDALRRRADSSVIRRLLGKCPVQPLDAKILAAVLYGPDADKEAYVAELIGESAAKI